MLTSWLTTGRPLTRVSALGLLFAVAALASSLAVRRVNDRLQPAADGEQAPPKFTTLSAVRAVARTVVDPDLAFGRRPEMTILVVGRDVDRDRRGRVLKTNGRTDSNIIVHLSRLDHSVRILSIPRDTLVHIPRYGTQRINAAHSFGGIELLLQTLHDSFCLDIDHYVRVDFQGSIAVVDAIGGLDIEVEKRMKYDDNGGRLHIDLQPGWQHLDGDKTHQYIRFRHDREGDIGRIRRQQQVVRAIVHKLAQPSTWPRLPRVVDELYSVITTDMTPEELLSLCGFMRKVPSEDIESFTLPGAPGGACWVVRAGAAGDVLAEACRSKFDARRWRYSAGARMAAISPPQRPSEIKAEPAVTDQTLEELLEMAGGSGSSPPAAGSEPTAPTPPPTPEATAPPPVLHAPTPSAPAEIAPGEVGGHAVVEPPADAQPAVQQEDSPPAAEKHTAPAPGESDQTQPQSPTIAPPAPPKSTPAPEPLLEVPVKREAPRTPVITDDPTG